jgi:hypothetical protein
MKFEFSSIEIDNFVNFIQKIISDNYHLAITLSSLIKFSNYFLYLYFQQSELEVLMVSHSKTISTL